MQNIIPADIESTIRDENVIIELTTRCNSNCSFCFARAGLSCFRDIPENTAVNIIREAREAGYSGLHLTGGEPFLWEPLFRILELASETGYRSVLINTNGSMLDSDTCARISDIGVDVRLSISLQGPREHHERFRGEGSWDMTLRGIECSLGKNIPVHIFTTVGKSLIPILPRFIKNMFESYPGISSVTLIQIIRVFNDVFDLKEELLDPVHFISMVKSAALLNLSGMSVHILENPLAHAVSILIDMPWLPLSLPLHRAGRITFMADWSMTLSHSSRASLGEYRIGALERVLASDAYREGISPDRVTCPQCRHFDHCRASGMVRPSEWYRETGQLSHFCAEVLDLACGRH